MFRNLFIIEIIQTLMSSGKQFYSSSGASLGLHTAAGMSSTLNNNPTANEVSTKLGGFSTYSTNQLMSNMGGPQHMTTTSSIHSPHH